MAVSKPDISHKQVGVDRYLNYYDIMILGKTGTGKTTTAEKILIANPTGKDYSYVPPEQDSPTASTGVVVTDPSLQDTSTASEDDGSTSTTPRKVEPDAKTCHDISMWHLGGTDDLENMSLRLKNLVFCRTLQEPHEEVIRIHKKESKSTEICELLSNDTSKIRVMDVPGFYGSNVASFTESLPPTIQATTLDATERRRSNTTNVHTRAQITTETDLSIMRKILHIKMAMKFKFNRIVYFLPEAGVLVRNSQILQIEIAIMEHFFGRSIFECMVAVATHSCSAYRHFPKDVVDLYTPEDFENTKGVFHAALSEVFDNNNVPEPPIIFISLRDSCNEVLRKIRESQVVREGVNLCFNPSTCARCNIKIGKLKDKKGEKKEAKEEDGKEIAICTYDSWSAAIPYDDSTCHPMMIPKYTTIQRVAGGIAHLLTFMAFEGKWEKWPSFGNFEEICIKCRAPPKERGCTRVRTDYIHEKSRGIIHVNHTSEVEESFIIELDPDDEPREDDEETVTVMGKKH